MFDSTVLAAIFDHCDIDTQLRMAGSCPQLHAQFGRTIRELVAQTGIVAAFSAGSVVLAKYLPLDNNFLCRRIACEADNFELVKVAIDRECKPFKCTTHNALGMHLEEVCRLGRLEAANYIADCGDMELNPALRVACGGGHVAVVAMLLGRIDKRCDELAAAIELNDERALIAAIRHERYNNCVHSDNVTPDEREVYDLCVLEDWCDVARKIIARHSDLSYALSAACEFGNVAIVDMLISHGAKDWDGGLIGACHGGHADLAEMMLRNGAIDMLGAFSHTRIAIRTLLYCEVNEVPYNTVNITMFAARLDEFYRIVVMLVNHDTANTVNLRALADCRAVALRCGYRDFADKLRDIGVRELCDYADDE